MAVESGDEPDRNGVERVAEPSAASHLDESYRLGDAGFYWEVRQPRDTGRGTVSSVCGQRGNDR